MPPHPNPDIAFHAFAEGGVLHRIGSHRLWVLNVTAATLWCLLDGRRDTRKLAGDYGRRFGIDTPTALRDVDTLLNRFAEWGLLSGGTPPEGIGTRKASRLNALGESKPLAANLSGLPRTIVSLAGRCFAVILADEGLAATWQALFQHLASDGCRAESDFVILDKTAEGSTVFRCYEKGRSVHDGLGMDEVVPFLVYKLFEHGMAALGHRLLFHAAVLARDGRALLLPAQSGSGKSTLAAALSASGWTYLSDELAVLDPQTLCVAPFALPIGLKDKSMAALDAFIPGVADLPRHVRMDGVGVRYLPPLNPPPAAPLPVAALVFPRYAAAAPATMTPLPPLEALQRLADTGSSARPLVSQDVKAMLQLASLPSYALHFSELDIALEAIKKI